MKAICSVLKSVMIKEKLPKVENALTEFEKIGINWTKVSMANRCQPNQGTLLAMDRAA